MLSIILATSILSSIPNAVEKTMTTLGDFEDPELVQLKRRTYQLEVENEVTRVLADAMALRLGTGACDIASTGWAIESGAAEQNRFLGGSRNNALIIIGSKAVLLVGEYFWHRKKGNDYKACMLRVYDGANEECNQLSAVKRSVAIVSTSRLGACAWNAKLALDNNKEK